MEKSCSTCRRVISENGCDKFMECDGDHSAWIGIENSIDEKTEYPLTICDFVEGKEYERKEFSGIRYKLHTGRVFRKVDNEWGQAPWTVGALIRMRFKEVMLEKTPNTLPDESSLKSVKGIILELGNLVSRIDSVLEAIEKKLDD